MLKSPLFISFLGFAQSFYDTAMPVLQFLIALITLIYMIIKTINERKKHKS